MSCSTWLCSPWKIAPAQKVYSESIMPEPEPAGESTAPIASTISGTSITGGLSWTWCMVCSSARGSPWKVSQISRPE